MKVGDKSTAIQIEAYLRQARLQQQLRTDAMQAVSSGHMNDKVDLSDRAREVQQAAKTLKEMPDVREDKVRQVRGDIENGTYRVVGSRVASDMLRDTFENNLILHQIDMRA